MKDQFSLKIIQIRDNGYTPSIASAKREMHAFTTLKLPFTVHGFKRTEICYLTSDKRYANSTEWDEENGGIYREKEIIAMFTVFQSGSPRESRNCHFELLIRISSLEFAVAEISTFNWPLRTRVTGSVFNTLFRKRITMEIFEVHSK